MSSVVNLIGCDTGSTVMSAANCEHCAMISYARDTVDAEAVLSCFWIVAFQVALPAGVLCRISDQIQLETTVSELT